MMQRFLYATDRDQTAVVALARNPQECLSDYATFLQRLAQPDAKTGSAAGQPEVRKFTPGAKEMFLEAKKSLEEAAENDPDIRSYVPKLIIYLARFSLILHESTVAEGGASPLVVGEDSVLGAYQLCLFYLDQYEVVMRLRKEQTSAVRCLKLVDAAIQKGGAISAREVCTRHVAGVRTAAEAVELMNAAARLGLGRIFSVSGPRGGKERVVFRLTET